MAHDPELRSLKSLIEFASAQAERIFRRTGILRPMYHAIKTTGETMIIEPKERDKDLAVAMMKAFLILNDVDRFVFMDEAWILDTRKSSGPQLDEKALDKIAREGLSKHPDRREVLMFAAENKRGEMLTAERFILRPEHGKASLSPLRFMDMTDVKSEGRMVGMLRL